MSSPFLIMSKKVMEGRIVNNNEYRIIERNVKNVFNTVEFTEINRDKVEKVIYLIIYDERSPRFGGIFGESDGVWYSPFSAPFGYVEPLKKNQNVKDFEDALIAIEKVAKEKNVKKITIKMPPVFYDINVISTWNALMLNSGWCIKYVDIDFSFNIKNIINDYDKKIYTNARRNLKKAFEAELEIRECQNLDEKRKAYDIIRVNRETKGYPLRMSEEQVLKTTEVVPSRFFIVRDKECDMAAALVYDVTTEVAQVIYWGDIPGYKDKKVINYLGYKLLEIYHSRGFSYLDIGPSTEYGVPNYGLCDFKDGIGCERVAKITIDKEI